MFWKISQISQINTRIGRQEMLCQQMFLKIFENSHKDIFFGVGDWKPETVKSSHCRWALKQSALKNFANFTEKNLRWSHFFIKLEFWRPATLLKKTATLVLSFEICNHFKNTYFEEHLWTSAAMFYLKRGWNIGFFVWILWIIQVHLFFL